MNNIYKFFLHIAFLCLSQFVFSQNIIVFNPTPDFFLLHKGIQNVSSFNNETFASNINYKNRIGQLSEIRNLYLDLSIPLNKKQWLGAKLFSEQETSIFTKSKLEFFYVNRVKLSRLTDLAFGAQGGLANINFKGTGASTGGGDFGLDFSVSSLLKVENFELGFAFKQIPQTSIRPINFEFILTRYFDSYLAYDFVVNESFNLELGLNAIAGDDLFVWQTNLQAIYKENSGLILRLGNDLSFAAGAFTSFKPIGEIKFKLGMSFSNSYYPGISNASAFSVFMNFSK